MLSQDSYTAAILTQVSEGADEGAGSQPLSAPASHAAYAATHNSDEPGNSAPQSGKMPSLESADFAMPFPLELLLAGDAGRDKGPIRANHPGRASSTPLEGGLQPEPHVGPAFVLKSIDRGENERQMAGKRKADALDEEKGFAQCPAVLCEVLSPLKHYSMHVKSCQFLKEEQRFKNNPHSPGQKRRVECGLCLAAVEIKNFVTHDCNPVATLQGKVVYRVTRCD